MHELSLFSPTTIPYTGVRHVLAVLAGIAAAQPVPYAALHLVFKPTRAPASAATRSTLPQQAVPTQRIAGAGGDLYYLQLVGMLHEAEKGYGKTGDDVADAATSTALGVNGTLRDVPIKDEGGDVTMLDSKPSQAPSSEQPRHSIPLAAQPWTLEFRDFPDAPGRRMVTSRLMASVPMGKGDALAFVRTLGYEFEAAHIRRGWQIVHGNVEVLVVKILPVPSGETAAPGALPTLPILKNSDLPIPDGTQGAGGGKEASSSNNASAQGSIGPGPPDVDSLAPLDPSGAYLLSANVRVADDGVPDVIGAGTQELLTLRNALRGIADLEVGERGALDTRVRG